MSLDENHIGNPKSDGVRSYTWEHGRQLASLSMGGVTWNYTYNSDGLRTVRTSNSKHYSYVYNGDKLAYMTAGDKHMYFAYDANGTPMSIVYSGTVYYYVTNVQGDVIALVDSTGAEKVSYSYDAWGKLLSTDGDLKDTLGKDNPLRYRSYVYDQETGLYYLQSRYYNPDLGRFINADNYPTTGQGLTGNNMFAYCGNNPISREDDGGEFWNFVVGAAVGAAIGVITTAVDAVKDGGWGALKSGKTWAKMGVSAVCGAINGTVAASGAHMLVGGLVGSATGFVESLSHELIDNNGSMNDESWSEVGVDTAVGFLGGLAGGHGAMHGNKYMAQQTTRFVKHIATDGIKKAGNFYLKMTVNYSKQFIKPALGGLARGWVGGKASNYGINWLLRRGA